MAQTNKRDNRAIAVVLLVAAALVAVGGISSYAAKYAHQATDGRELSSPAFYFTSDVLTEGGTDAYDLPVGTTSISFELRNYADDLRWCDTNIDYEYKVVAPDGTQLASGVGVITRDASKGVAVPISAAGLTQPGDLFSVHRQQNIPRLQAAVFRSVTLYRPKIGVRHRIIEE